MKFWSIWHVGTGAHMGSYKDKGTAQRWCREWTRTQVKHFGRVTPGFRVQRAPRAPMLKRSKE